jgi:hypothetical protein
MQSCFQAQKTDVGTAASTIVFEPPTTLSFCQVWLAPIPKKGNKPAIGDQKPILGQRSYCG